MVTKIHIKNFKSVYNADFELGRFNVLIGENASGKSNILEAIAFGGAASADLLSNEFLTSRGIRVTEAQLMLSAFSKTKKVKNCLLDFWADKKIYNYNIKHTKTEGWREKNQDILFSTFKNSILELYSEKTKQVDPTTQKIITSLLNYIPEDERKESFDEMINIGAEKVIEDELTNNHLSEFLIFSPENSYLRNFFDEQQIEPLGIKGEGLLKLLKKMSKEKGQKKFKKLVNHLKILEWVEKVEIPKTAFINEKYITIKDKYIDESIKYFDQRSANEGFLFLLFYLTLFISNETPVFFAIDNIDSSFNPKLCTQLIKMLVKLSKEHKKQVIVTTHNPFILDGLDLSDDKQRLFVVRRNIDGHTVSTRIKPNKSLSYKLSEAWMNGFIGGLPNNF
jgi:AAA15 family ATPase/GTPase